MLVYQVTQHAPLYWPYMLLFVTSVRGLSASDFGLLKTIYYFTVMGAEIPLGVVADRMGRRTTLYLAALANSAGCFLYASGASFAAFAVAELSFALASALQSGADSALIFDAYAADDRTHEFARAMGVLGTTSLVGATVAFVFAGFFVTAEGDPTPTYVVTALLSLVGAAAAFALREPPRVPTMRVRTHVAEALRDLVRARGLVAAIAYGAVVYTALRGANALLWNPVLGAAGVPLARLRRAHRRGRRCSAPSRRGGPMPGGSASVRHGSRWPSRARSPRCTRCSRSRPAARSRCRSWSATASRSASRP